MPQSAARLRTLLTAQTVFSKLLHGILHAKAMPLIWTTPIGGTLCADVVPVAVMGISRNPS
jgi:hypothetical protein